jgi:hypothetical protein
MAFFDRRKSSTGIFFIAVIFAAAALLSCHGQPDDITTQSFASDSHSKRAKPGAPVKLVSAPSISINSDQETSINIELETSEVTGYLEIDFVQTPNIHIINAELQQSVDIVNNPRVNIPVTLFAPLEGRYYLNMHVRVKNSESYLSRTIALIVQVGTEAEKAGQLKKTAGENIISLPAKEKISSQ